MPDHEHLPNFEGIYRKRQVDCAVELYNNMGIARDDRMGRMKATLRWLSPAQRPWILIGQSTWLAG